MLNITRIDHLGMAVPELEPRLPFFEQLLGFRVIADRDHPEDGTRRVRLAIPGTDLRWELLAPLGPSSQLHDFLDSTRGPGIHHATFDVPDIAEAARTLRAAGIEPATEDEHNVAIGEQGGHGLRFMLRGPEAARSGAAGEDAAAAAMSGDAEGTLGVIGVDHVCHACPDRDALGGWYERLFGMRETHRTPDGQHDDLADLVLAVPGEQMRWEVLQPVGDGSFVERFLERRGPSVHHVAFEVADWARAMAACERLEVPTFDESQGETDGAAWRDAFIHPKHTGGVLMQLFWEARPDAWVASDKVPSGR